MKKISIPGVLGLLAVASLSLNGCVSLNTTNLAPDLTYDPVPKDQVRIFQSEDEVPEPYQKLALFNASGSDSFTDESDLYDKMREEAAKRGCNGVVLQREEDAGTAEKIFFGAGADREATAVCMRYGKDVEKGESTSGESEESEGGNLPVIKL